MKMEPTEGSETSAFKTQMLGKYPKENILQHKEHSKSLKSRNDVDVSTLFSDQFLYSSFFSLAFQYTHELWSGEQGGCFKASHPPTPEIILSGVCRVGCGIIRWDFCISNQFRMLLFNCTTVLK
jgi:hypothetical protein